MNGEMMTKRDTLIELLELDDHRWGQYALTKDPLWSRLAPAERTGVVRQAQDTGKQAARKAAERLGDKGLEALCGAYGITVREERELSGCGLYLLARFEEPDQICLYEKTIREVDRFIRTTLPERFQCSARELVLAHELFHVLELQDPELPTNSLTVPVLKLGPFCWRRRLTVPGEIAAMSFAKALLDTPFYPQALDILLLYALEQEEAEGLTESILSSFGGKEE